MFCPNCGTQNPDAAATCSKCNFHLKSASAPKFKGTMLMMNQPGALGIPPAAPPAPAAPPGPPAAGAPPPPGARLGASKLKGTMVGVAPMAGGFPPLPFTPTAPVPAAGGASTQPPKTPAMGGTVGVGGMGGGGTGGAGGEGASGYSPPVPQPGVNPLGGTLVAADAGVFGAYAAQQQGLQQQHGSPPGGAASPPAYGAQPTPQAFGAPPPPAFPGAQPYGAAPPQASGGVDPFAQPPAHLGYGHSPPMHQAGTGTVGMAGMQGIPPAYDQEPPGHMLGTLKSEGARIAGPTRRNALLTLVLPAAVMFGGTMLSILLAVLVSPALWSIAMFFVLGGSVFYLLLAIQMISELKMVTRSEQLAWWALIVPFYSLYFMWILVPQEVAKAKQMLGVAQPPQNIALYIFLWPFALASDLNDMVRS